MKTPFKFVGVEPSHHTIEMVKQLHAEARSGEIIGLAFSAMRRGGSFTIGFVGECRRSPAFTLGTVNVMEYELVRTLANDRNGR